MRAVDPLAERGRCGGELDARVDALGLGRIGGDVGDDPLAARDEIAHGVGEVELALDVVRLEPVERRPEQVAAEDVDRGVALLDLQLLGRGVAGLDDPLDRAVGPADDAAVRTGVVGHEGEDGRRGALTPVLLDERLEQLGREERRVAGEDEDVLDAVPHGVARRADGIAGAERLLLDRDAGVAELVAALGRGDHDQRIRPERARGLEHPVDHPPPEDRVQVLRGRRAHARAEPSGHHHGCD